MRSNHTLLNELNGLGLICIELEKKARQEKKAYQDLD